VNMYLFVINFTSFYDFAIGFWSCSDSVVFFTSFLAHLAKGHVSFWHHLASVVVRPSVRPSVRRTS